MNDSSPAAGGRSRVVDAWPSSPGRSQPIRLVIVDDHPVFLEGLSRVLSRQSDFSVVGVAAGGREALQVWERHRPDVLVLDLMMSDLDGIESLRRLRRSHPDCRVLILTSSDDPANATAAFAAGACGYITKTARYEEIVAAIRDVHAGNACGAKGVRSAPAAVALTRAGLTAREVEVLSLVRQGFGNEEIGRKLGISMRTAKGHMATILDKLGASDRAEAVSRGFELGIFSAPPR